MPRSKRRRTESYAVTWSHLPQARDWSAWTEHLATRRVPKSIDRLVHKPRIHPLYWGPLEDPGRRDQFPRLDDVIRSGNDSDVDRSDMVAIAQDWIVNAPTRDPSIELAFECLAWAHAVPRLAGELGADQWCALLQQVSDVAAAAAALSVDDEPLVYQLMAGELPLTLAYLLPELASCRDGRADACGVINTCLTEMMDGEGLLQGRYHRIFRALMASWTRCAVMAHAAQMTCFDKSARYQYEWAVRQMLRLTRADGGQVLTSGSLGTWCPELVTQCLCFAGDAADRTIAAVLLPRLKLDDSRASREALPAPALYSEWAETAVLRTEWRRKAPQLSVIFNAGRVRTELANGGHVVWSGDCTPALQIAGQTRDQSSDWRELCWHSDADVDYLELQADFAPGWQIQRQILLAREDQFLLLADAVLGNESHDVSLTVDLPLGDDVNWTRESVTRDGVLAKDRPLATLLPLALPQWRSASAHGSVSQNAHSLRLRMTGTAPALYGAWFFDLASRRLAKQRTWRRLTVAAQRVIQPASVAAGYRVQVGQQQWLIYRSLAAPANRSLLGQNLSQEFVAARFLKAGEMESLIEIDNV